VLDPTDGTLGEQLRCLDVLCESLGDTVPFIQTIFNPLAQAKNLAGEETLLLHMRQNAGQVHHALETISDTTIRFIHEARNRGIAGIYYAIQHANYLSMSEAEYQVFGKPYDLQVLNAASDLWLNVLHIHGPHGMFGPVADYPVQIVNWHDRESPPSLETGLKRIKGAASGGVDRDVLHGDDPALALEQARQAFGQTQGRRWILGTGCVMLITTPYGNIRRLRALADELKPNKK
jgi:uroporphyrinogen decarboxylase